MLRIWSLHLPKPHACARLYEHSRQVYLYRSLILQFPGDHTVATPKIAPQIDFLPEYSAFDSSNSTQPSGSARRIARWLSVFMDLALVWIASGITLAIRVSPLFDWRKTSGVPHTINLGVHIAVLVLYSGLVILLCQAHGLYHGVAAINKWHEAWSIIRAVFFAGILLIALIFLLRASQVSRMVVVSTCVGSAAFLSGWRWHISNRVTAGYNCRNVLIVGANILGESLKRHLEAQRHLGYRVKGILDVEARGLPANWREQLHAIDGDVLGGVDALRDVARAHFIDEILIAVPADRELVKRITRDARECGLGVRVVPDLYDGLAWGAPVEYLGLFPTLSLHMGRVRELELKIKRAIDIVFSALVLTVGLPVLMVTALAIRLDSPGPIFYRSLRVGKKGKTFECLKFRTMVTNADELLGTLRHLNEREGLLFKIADDPRVTRLGHWLRKYSLDELPQFWNVLKGEMSLVGPRPALASEFHQYDLSYFRRLDTVPGITGLWQVEGRQDPSFESYINLDTQYVEYWTLSLDFKLLLKTIAVVLAGTGR